MLNLTKHDCAVTHALDLDEYDTDLMLRGMWETWGQSKDPPPAYILMLMLKVAMHLDRFRIPF